MHIDTRSVLIGCAIFFITIGGSVAQTAFSESPVHTLSVRDQSATLQCSVKMFTQGDEMKWFKDGQGYVTAGTSSALGSRLSIEGGDESYMMGQYNLRIANLIDSDAGNYACIYIPSDGTTSATTPGQLIVLRPPVCTEDPNSVHVVGDRVTLTCTIDDFTLGSVLIINSNVKWIVRNMPISPEDPKTISTERTLSGSDNYNIFVCKAIITGRPDLDRSCELTPLMIPPSAMIYPQDMVNIAAGEMVTYRCSATAQPHVASIDWFINGQSVTNYDYTFTTSLSQDRSYLNLTAKDNEPEMFLVHCKVYDPSGITINSGSVILVVSGSMPTTPTQKTTTNVMSRTRTEINSPTPRIRPTMSTDMTPKSESINFVEKPSDTHTTEGSTIVLYCSVNNIGDGDMKWFKVQTGTYILVGLRVSIAASEDVRQRYSIVGGEHAYSKGQYFLQIINAKPSDSGTYFCSYTTPESTSISSPYAVITFVAQVICHQTPNIALPAGSEVTMSCSVDDNDGNTVFMWRDNRDIQLTGATTNSTTYALVLQPIDNFRVFVCSATNAEFDLVRTCSLTPLAISPIAVVIATSLTPSVGEAVNFSCKAEAEPYVSRYQWLINGIMTLTEYNETFEINIIENDTLSLVPIGNNEEDVMYYITCVVFIPSGESATSEAVSLLLNHTINDVSPAVNSSSNTVILILLCSLGPIVCFVILALLYTFCYRRRKKLSLDRKISFSGHAVSGQRYGARPSVTIPHIDGFSGNNDTIYATPLKLTNVNNTDESKTSTSEEAQHSIYENHRPVSLATGTQASETEQYDNVIKQIGFSNFGYRPESPTESKLDISTLPKSKSKPSPPKRLFSFEPLPDICHSKPNTPNYGDICEIPEGNVANEEELIYSNEPAHYHVNDDYDDFDSDSFDSESEYETHM